MLWIHDRVYGCWVLTWWMVQVERERGQVDAALSAPAAADAGSGGAALPVVC